MKIKAFLTILPVCLCMISCNSINKKEYTNDPFKNTIEDVEANDNVFLDAELKYLDPVSSNEPSVGIQTASAESGTSIRFVGAITIPDPDEDGTDEDDFTAANVKWKRAAYLTNGSTYKDRTEIPATKFYKRIGAAGSAYSISQYNTEHNTNYTHFVTYVIRNIPEEQAKAHITVRLMVDTSTSKTIVTSGDLKTQFTYDGDFSFPGSSVLKNFFGIVKTSSGCRKLDSTITISGSSWTKKFETILNSYDNDSFMFIQTSSVNAGGTALRPVYKGVLRVFGYDDFVLSSNSGVNLVRDGESDLIKPSGTANGLYEIYLDNSNNMRVETNNNYKDYYLILASGGNNANQDGWISPYYLCLQTVENGESITYQYRAEGIVSVHLQPIIPEPATSLSAYFKCAQRTGTTLEGFGYSTASYVNINNDPMSMEAIFEWQTSND